MPLSLQIKKKKKNCLGPKALGCLKGQVSFLYANEMAGDWGSLPPTEAPGWGAHCQGQPVTQSKARKGVA